jgi:hypothetical protein
VTNNFLSGETMKRLQELVLASVVILVLAIATFAGEIPTGGKTPPPPPPEPASATASGETAIDPGDTQGDEYQLVEDIVPDLLLVMLSVF